MPRGFQPDLSAPDPAGHLDCPKNRDPVDPHCRAVDWCDTLIFVYPTWWFGFSAMLKGWLDRVLWPDMAFLMPDERNATIRPGLLHIRRLGIFTTCGAGRWLSLAVGASGKRHLMRGVGWLCLRRACKVFAAHHLMDRFTPQSRTRHLACVARAMDKLTKGAAAPARAPTFKSETE